MADGTTLQGAATALRLLRLMADHSPLGVRQAARLLDVTPTAAQRLLRTLDAEGYAHRSATDKTYTLSPLVVRIASAFIERHDFSSLVGGVLARLQASTGETVALYGHHDGLRVCLREAQSSHALRMVAKTGNARTITNGATDKVFRAFVTTDELVRIDTRLAELDGASALNSRPGREELDEVKNRGWAQSRGVRVPGSAAVSAAVQLPDAVYVLSVFGPRERMDGLGADKLPVLVSSAARELESMLAWTLGPHSVVSLE